MRAIRLAALTLVLGVATNCAVYSEPPGYGSTQPPQRYDDYGQGYDDRYYGAPAPQIEVGFFYDELSPYGDWVRSRDYGWAWFPRDVHSGWRPYSEGRWVNTAHGWTWASYEPFGWATYHYGRWAWDARFGWLWIPGTTWGPAWVSWQYGNGYIGWAPLPPTVGFSISVGLQLGGLDLRFGIRPDAYCFVPERSFLEPRLSGYYLPTARNVTIINNTTNITNYTYIDNRIINRGVEVQRIERATGRSVKSMRLAESRTKARSEIAVDEVRIYRPERQKLETVLGKQRAEEEQKKRAATAPVIREQRQPAVERRREAPEVIVAPRAGSAARTDTKKIEQQERREKQELDRYLAEEKKKVERLHQQEKAQARAEAERREIERRHQAERQALQQEEREAAQQLEARQKAKREATLAKPPAQTTQKGKEKAAAVKKDSKKDEKKGKGKQEKPEAPPPA